MDPKRSRPAGPIKTRRSTGTENDDEALRGLLSMMWLVRAFEERVSELFFQRLIAGLLHLGIGQEGVAVGACSALRRDDVVYGSHRAHAHAIAKGADPVRLLAELAGRSTGYCGGRGGSMHISAPEVGFMAATGVVAGNIPLAVGAAVVCRRRGQEQVAVCFFGDGAGQTGYFHESLNLVALWNLPLIMVCENNGWAEFTPLSSHTLIERLARHAETYGIASATVDGNDVLAVRQAVSDAAARARSGGGPSFIECLTHRLRGHYEGDPAKYRQLSELDEWKQKDPILRFQRLLNERGIAIDAATVEREARDRVGAAAQEALAAPWPSDGETESKVYADA